ncbi:phosphatase PAP2 family protein [Pedobacter nanyangensis]|uniref:phosphatase PAP2 family protein n=1 Tax=Pedobacter nanyangensis TaxID=1562389 RepID=UPI000DE23AB7|nr:phosphatase PAP2 family protein [Pedobacter nanyangensis]
MQFNQGFAMNNSPRLFYSILLIISFAVLAFFVGQYPINGFDLAISTWIQQFHQPVLDQVMIIISAFGNVAIAFCCMAVTAMLFFVFKFRREAWFTIAISFTGLLTFILKRLFNRPRPSNEYVTIVESYHNHSFPSGHTLSYVVFFGFLILLMHRLTTIPGYLRTGISAFSYLMIVMGPLSRIYLGAHWFTDILGGFLIGGLYLLHLNYHYKKA